MRVPGFARRRAARRRDGHDHAAFGRKQLVQRGERVGHGSAGSPDRRAVASATLAWRSASRTPSDPRIGATRHAGSPRPWPARRGEGRAAVAGTRDSVARSRGTPTWPASAAARRRPWSGESCPRGSACRRTRRCIVSGQSRHAGILYVDGECVCEFARARSTTAPPWSASPRPAGSRLRSGRGRCAGLSEAPTSCRMSTREQAVFAGQRVDRRPPTPRRRTRNRKTAARKASCGPSGSSACA